LCVHDPLIVFSALFTVLVTARFTLLF